MSLEELSHLHPTVQIAVVIAVAAVVVTWICAIFGNPFSRS